MGFSDSSDGRESAGNTGDPVLIHGLEISPEESETYSVMSDSLWPYGLYSPWNSPGQNTGMGSLSLLQGIFRGLNPDLLHCRQILCQLNYQGKGMATHSSILAWRIPWTEEPGRLQSTGHEKLGMPEQITHMSKMNTDHGGL